MSKVGESLQGAKIDAIICVAGGWAGGNAASKGKYTNVAISKYPLEMLVLYSFK